MCLPRYVERGMVGKKKTVSSQTRGRVADVPKIKLFFTFWQDDQRKGKDAENALGGWPNPQPYAIGQTNQLGPPAT